MNKYSNIKTCNHEFSKYTLQTPLMSAAEQIFHCSKEHKTRVRVEVERSELSSLQEAMNLQIEGRVWFQTAAVVLNEKAATMRESLQKNQRRRKL